MRIAGRVAAIVSETESVHELVDELATGEAAIIQARKMLVAYMREQGATWREIGEALHISAQGARQRYGAKRGA